jgi:hypothetical protein
VEEEWQHTALFVEEREVVQEVGDMKPASNVDSHPVVCRARDSSV